MKFFASFVPLAIAFSGTVSAIPLSKRDANQTLVVITETMTSIQNDMAHILVSLLTVALDGNPANGQDVALNMQDLVNDINQGTTSVQGAGQLDQNGVSIIAEVFSEGFAPQVVMVVDAVANQIVSLGTLGVGDTVITSLQSLSGGLANYTNAILAAFPSGSANVNMSSPDAQVQATTTSLQGLIH